MVDEYGGDHLDLRGGEFNGPVVVKGNFYQQAAAPTALNALPVRAAGFTGRGDELDELLRALDPSAPAGGAVPVVVAAVSGLGGIGKTALAVEGAHEACGRGWFPGGVLFLDLHGYDDDPVTGEQALEALLRALGTEPAHIPARGDQRAALYRSLLVAREQERGAVLVLADNASSATQVRPLLPGGARHRLLVTSRGKLGQLAARLLPLGELTPLEAYDLLDRALRIADPGDDRAPAETGAVADVAARCGHLPLALQIAAALLVLDRDKRVSELAEELTEFRERLVQLDDGERSVRAAFDLSYRRLPPEQARLLRLLALAPGPDASVETVTVLAGTDTASTKVLNALARAHLVEQGKERGRWRLHDLVRAFGAGLVAGDADWAEEGAAARERLLDHYAWSADAADSRMRWLPGREEPERFATWAEALAWFDAERAGLVEAVHWASEGRLAKAAVRLAGSLGYYLEWRRFRSDGITVAGLAVRAAGRLGERDLEAEAWGELGNALRSVGRSEEAIEALIRGLYHSAGNPLREPAAWNDLGLALEQAGRMEDAIDAFTRACRLYRADDDRGREAIALSNLGAALLRRPGRLTEALDTLTRALHLSRDAGDRRRGATAWHSLGHALQDVGRLTEAKAAFETALHLCKEFDDWYGIGVVLESLARAHEADSDVAQARITYQRAAYAYTRTDMPERVIHCRNAADRLTP
ncbi:tetratricopeptide repeat protein [Streptomyces justiciae]|uniref:tetratricopeptide repeat protein n=1 Tax=Streptomyces justiciae TaxID=2780140 RepID=UPI0021186152|nr:tetratricopeptide repeat protein [Streptomyces justiciae]MCW8383685.1 tetratricopeptide repeat protein [Streptomyces justiciae]